MNPYDLDPTVADTNKAVNEMQNSIQTGTALTSLVGDDAQARSMVGVIDRVKQALETGNPPKHVVEDLLDANPNPIRELMATIAVLAAAIECDTEILSPDIHRRATAIGYAAMPIADQLCLIVSHAEGINDRAAGLATEKCDKIKLIVASIIEKADEAQRLLEARP